VSPTRNRTARAVCHRSGNCKASGARRAGQGRAAAKRTLDAPKRSRKIETGATANDGATVLTGGVRSRGSEWRGFWSISTPSRPEKNATVRSRNCGWSKPRNLELVFDATFPGEPASLIARFRKHEARAPAHFRHRHVGRERPGWRPRGRLCDAQAGSLTPNPCCDTCAGALTGRHKPPPAPTAAPAPTWNLPRSCHGWHVAWLGRAAQKVGQTPLGK
jgi:hypothetical protein